MAIRTNAGNRSNYSLMPFEIRFRICTLLHDGATTDAVASDPEVKAAYARIGSRLNRNGVMRIKRCAEYKKICATLEKERLDAESDRLAAAILRENKSAETISDTLQIELLNLVKACTAANPDDTKEVERLVRSAVNLRNHTKDKQLDRANAEIEELKAELAELEVRRKNDLAEKDARIAELEQQIPGVDSGKVADAMDHKFGV